MILVVLVLRSSNSGSSGSTSGSSGSTSSTTISSITTWGPYHGGGGAVDTQHETIYMPKWLRANKNICLSGGQTW